MMVLAHYGGIDEIGIFVIPALAVFLLLRRAERRARARQPGKDDAETPASDSKVPEDRT